MSKIRIIFSFQDITREQEKEKETHLGETRKKIQQLKRFIRRLRKYKYKERYHYIYLNCIVFVNDLCVFLCGHEIPMKYRLLTVFMGKNILIGLYLIFEAVMFTGLPFWMGWRDNEPQNLYKKLVFVYCKMLLQVIASVAEDLKLFKTDTNSSKSILILWIENCCISYFIYINMFGMNFRDLVDIFCLYVASILYLKIIFNHFSQYRLVSLPNFFFARPENDGKDFALVEVFGQTFVALDRGGVYRNLQKYMTICIFIPFLRNLFYIIFSLIGTTTPL